MAYTTAQSPGMAGQQQQQRAMAGRGGGLQPQQDQLAAPSAAEPPRPLSPSSPAPAASIFEGFDGLGNDEAAYSLAQVRTQQQDETMWIKALHHWHGLVCVTPLNYKVLPRLSAGMITARCVSPAVSLSLACLRDGLPDRLLSNPFPTTNSCAR